MKQIECEECGGSGEYQYAHGLCTVCEGRGYVWDDEQ